MPQRSRSYPWPASRIDRDVMHELHLASRESGRPITTLIADAVHTAMTARLDRPQAPVIGFQAPQGHPQSAA